MGLAVGAALEKAEKRVSRYAGSTEKELMQELPYRESQIG